MIYTAIVIVVTLKVALESASCTVIHYLTFIGSIFSWFLVVVVYAAVWPAVDVIIPPQAPRGIVDIRYTMRGAYFDFYNSAGNGVFWFAMLLAVILALSRDTIWKAIVHNVALNGWLRQVYHVVQDMERWNEEISEDNVRARCPELFDNLKPPVRTVKKIKGQRSPPKEIETVELSTVPRDTEETEHTGFGFSQTEGGQAEMLKEASASFRGSLSFRKQNTSQENTVAVTSPQIATMHNDVIDIDLSGKDALIKNQ
jgi:hypothetical protein